MKRNPGRGTVKTNKSRVNPCYVALHRDFPSLTFLPNLCCWCDKDSHLCKISNLIISTWIFTSCGKRSLAIDIEGGATSYHVNIIPYVYIYIIHILVCMCISIYEIWYHDKRECCIHNILGIMHMVHALSRIFFGCGLVPVDSTKILPGYLTSNYGNHMTAPLPVKQP